MSWFGDTFGDSLNTLKGQITKITKEVLADEETLNNESQESEIQTVKELEALCESKDLELASLRDKLQKLQNQNEAELECLDKNAVEKLENEIVQLRQEREHLNSCLDELQSEHQVNLDQVISIRDKYKTELEELRLEYDLVKKKLDELTASDPFTDDKDNKISLLNSQIEKLQLELGTVRREKEESLSSVKKEIEDQSALKKQLEKLMGDIQEITNDKQKTDEQSKSIRSENEFLRNQLNAKEKEVKEIEIKLKLLSNEKEELFKKCQNQDIVETKLSGLISSQTEVQNKLKSLLLMINADVDENDIFKVLNVIEEHLKCLFKTSENVKELESELNKLREENERLHDALKTSAEKWSETERNFQEEISSLKKSISEMKGKNQDCLNQSQTDDVKRLEQELANFMSLMVTKNNEINDYSKSLKNLELELQNLRTASSNTEEELLASKKEKKTLEEEVERLKGRDSETVQEMTRLKEKLENVEIEKSNLNELNNQLTSKADELEKNLSEVAEGKKKIKRLEEELEDTIMSKSYAENRCSELEKVNASLKKDFDHLKAQVIVKESSVGELMKANAYFQEEMNKLQAENKDLAISEKEIKKWKEASVDLEIQRQDLIASKEELEGECLRLRSEVELSRVKDAEIQQLRQTNASLIESCNQLHSQLESKAQGQDVERNELETLVKKQSDLISELQEENAELKSRIHKFQEQMKIQIVGSPNQANLKEEVQQHRRSKSDVDVESSAIGTGPQVNEDHSLLKQAIQQEQAKNRLLQQELQEISDKEANARKKFERLKQHLIEVEEHYTEAAVENEKIINDLKSKLIAAEEQLQNSSTLYTSLKVRDNQHLESLQSQIRMVSAQRDDLQVKLSAAEDEVQKHKASLMSLQIVLEQFQQDKEREVEEVAMKYEKQLQLTHARFRDLEMEIEGLKKQLGEAKNGLKAASRLGEQLEMKSQQASELERNLSLSNEKVIELEKNLASASQAQNSKIDKSLIKNLVVGYVLSPNAERKSQVLKIMASVLDLDQEERNKMGVDATNSGWLSNILHPKGGAPSNQSLSEAFIKFLENESRPQPQLKLVPEQFQSSAPKPSRTSPKPLGRISELTLPTFNSSQENESNILKNVLKDS